MPMLSRMEEQQFVDGFERGLKLFVREALAELADSLLDREDYNRVVDPFRPSLFSEANLTCPVELPHRDRDRAGAELFRDDASVAAYARQYPTLADLYRGEGDALLGAILIDAHLAASAIGATPTARLEDTKVDPITGDLLIAFTSGSPGGKGGADPAVFRGPLDHGCDRRRALGWRRWADQSRQPGTGSTGQSLDRDRPLDEVRRRRCVRQQQLLVGAAGWGLSPLLRHWTDGMRTDWDLPGSRGQQSFPGGAAPW